MKTIVGEWRIDDRIIKRNLWKANAAKADAMFGQNTLNIVAPPAWVPEFNHVFKSRVNMPKHFG